MVATLIKHEFLRTRSWLAVVFGAATIMLLVGVLMELTPWGAIQGIGFALTLVPVFALLLVVQVALAFDYWRSSYSKTGYFTQSLPIKGSTIYGAKFLWGSLVTIVVVLVNIVMAGVALLGASRAFDLGITLRGALDELAIMLAAAPVWFWAGVTVLVLALFVSSLAQFLFAASIGSEGRMGRLGVGGPILIYFALYMVMQVLLFVAIIAVPLGLSSSPLDGNLEVVPMNVLGSMVSNQDPDALPLGFIPMLFIVSAVLVWRTVVSWNKKVSLV